MRDEAPIKRAGIGGILFGVLACLLCALPLVFGVVGFAWLAMLEKFGLFTALIGVSLLVRLWYTKRGKAIKEKKR